ncbi:hypothetical protein ACOMHN_055886 [Nucella lapillus]
MPDSGSCSAHAPYWFYNVTSERCERFVYGQCGGNDNRFTTADTCYQHCKSSASPCHSSKKKCSGNQVCQLIHPSDCFTGHCSLTAHCAEAFSSQEVTGVHVPQCTREGQYQLRQCHADLCWCVRPDDGQPFPNPLTSAPASLTCQNGGPAQSNYAKIKCSGGQEVGAGCVDKCRDARCPGHPHARCLLDLCTCTTRFVDSSGATLTCADDTCSGNAFMKAANKMCTYESVCGGQGPKRCVYEAGCVGAWCANNPCAVCRTDPCTGLVTFTDTLTRRAVSPTACKHQVTHTNCQLRQCEVMTHNARANVSDAALHVPQCQEDGSYAPLQRQQDGSLVCVDAYGTPRNASDDTGDCEMDPVVKVELHVVYEGTFDDVVPPRKGEITQAFTQALVKIGIPEPIISQVQVSPGSIVFSTEIVQHPEYTLDLAVVRPLVQFRALSGDLTLHVSGGVTLRVKRGVGVRSSPTTASQLPSPPLQGGLAGGAVAAIVIVLLIAAGAAGGVAFYFLYYKRRMAERDGNENPYPTKGGVEGVENKTFSLFTIFHALTNLTNRAPSPADDFVEEPMEDHYVKVRQ